MGCVKDNRYREIGGKHRALSRYYMLLNRTKTTNRSKNKCYSNVKVLISKEDFVKWFMENDFEGASVDRIDKFGDYELGNIQLISLAENIAKDKTKAKDGYCVCYRCGEKKEISAFVKDSRRSNGHTTICKVCEAERGRLKYYRLKYKNTGELMEKNTALMLIENYLTEPNSISREWIDCLLYCRECIKKVDELNAEIEHLKGVVNEALGVKL